MGVGRVGESGACCRCESRIMEEMTLALDRLLHLPRPLGGDASVPSPGPAPQACPSSFFRREPWRRLVTPALSTVTRAFTRTSTSATCTFPRALSLQVCHVRCILTSSLLGALCNSCFSRTAIRQPASGGRTGFAPARHRGPLYLISLLAADVELRHYLYYEHGERSSCKPRPALELSRREGKSKREDAHLHILYPTLPVPHLPEAIGL